MKNITSFLWFKDNAEEAVASHWHLSRFRSDPGYP